MFILSCKNYFIEFLKIGKLKNNNLRLRRHSNPQSLGLRLRNTCAWFAKKTAELVFKTLSWHTCSATRTYQLFETKLVGFPSYHKSSPCCIEVKRNTVCIHPSSLEYTVTPITSRKYAFRVHCHADHIEEVRRPLQCFYIAVQLTRHNWPKREGS